MDDQIQAIQEAYVNTEVPSAKAAWPADVQVFYRGICQNLFVPQKTIGQVRDECGIGNHNVTTRFARYVGEPTRDFVRLHRVQLATQLLAADEFRDLPLIQIAMSVGYQSHGGFSKAFKAVVGQTPTRYKAVQ